MAVARREPRRAPAGPPSEYPVHATVGSPSARVSTRISSVTRKQESSPIPLSATESEPSAAHSNRTTLGDSGSVARRATIASAAFCSSSRTYTRGLL
jgi:hypothetical protein